MSTHPLNFAARRRRLLAVLAFAGLASCSGSPVDNPVMTPDAGAPVVRPPPSTESPTQTTGSSPVENPDAASSPRPAPAPERDAAAPADQAAADRPAGSDMTPPAAATLPGWRLVWNDEFNGPAGGAPDPGKWNFQIGPNANNRELQYYTARRENAALDGTGNLLIVARREPFMNQAYTSARMNTGGGKFAQSYGRFEIRAKLPVGQGLWAAFWLMGANFAQAGWPECGEIDILENMGSQPTVNYGSLHGPGYSAGAAITSTYRLPAGTSFDTSFHVFAVEWEPEVVRFYVDGQLYQTRTPASLTGRRWVYDHPFQIILNLAVGGFFPGDPNATTVFPQTFAVDHVRVYAR